MLPTLGSRPRLKIARRNSPATPKALGYARLRRSESPRREFRSREGGEAIQKWLISWIATLDLSVSLAMTILEKCQVKVTKRGTFPYSFVYCQTVAGGKLRKVVPKRFFLS